MAVTTSGPFCNPLLTAIVIDTSANATAEVNVRGGATTVFAIEVDNTANAAATYLKLYDAVSVVVGTTAPDYVFLIPALTSKRFILGHGIEDDGDFLFGDLFSNGLTFAAVTAGGTGGTDNPGSAVPVRFYVAELS